ncbi:13376_t:CDS:10 [Dentiscutata erythropus]|uniref:13376_t:CDS:1 n=1 Tax=Dentiscutata erythropus TaxID=1348616 RepID=A0A9N9BA25_9GLOM|nr:13376_t:CDS:10 [Dentiscutata erythropus]
MSISQIYYKFKSAKDYDTLTFDGLGISVFDAKKEILTAKKLKGNDFDIIVSHAESGEGKDLAFASALRSYYQEDTATIPRNTPIVVKRVPTKPGKGTAHRYLEGGGPTTQRNYVANNRASNGSMSKTFDPSKQPQQVSRLTPTPSTQQTDEHQTEDDKIQAMFAQSKEFWDITQEQMASKPALRRPNQVRPSVKPPVQKTLPPNYVCYRCGQKGHWIQACPTNGDRSFDHMKVRKTTGIPRSFLQKVEQVPPGKGVLVTQDGNLVIAQANEAAWQKFHARQKSYVTSNEVLEDTLPIPAELQCMLCSRLLKEAVITPCCRASFCDECIRHALINPEQDDQQFKCPNCQSHLVPDELVPNKAARETVDGHLRDWARRRNEPTAPENHEEDESNTMEMLEDPLVVNNNVDLSVEKDTTESLNELMIKTEEKEKSTSGLSETVPDNTENSSQSPQISKAKVESVPSQGYGPFGYYNDYGFGYDQNQGYWYDEGYPPMGMNMMNGPGYYDPSYFDGFYPAEPFPSQPQFMPHFRPPVYDEFWDNRPMMPPQGNFVPFAGNMGNGMGGSAGMQPFRGGNFRGGFSRGNFPNRARGRGRGSPGFFNDRSSFASGRSGIGDFRRESSVPPSIGRRDMSDYRDDEPKYDDDRLVDDFGRDLARRKSSASRVSAERDIEPRDKKHDSRHSRSPSRHDRSSPDRRKTSSSRRRSRSREAYVDRKDERRYSSGRYYDDRRYSIPEKREERRDSNLPERRESRRDSNLSDRRGDRRNSDISERRDDRHESKNERRDDRRESYSSRYEKSGSINERRDPKHDSVDDRKENNSLSNERFDYEEYKNSSRTRSPAINHENGKSEYPSPNHNIDTDIIDDRVSPPVFAEQLSEDIDRRTRSRSPKPILAPEDLVPDDVYDDDNDNVIDVSTNDDDALLLEDDRMSFDDRPTTPPSPEKYPSSSSPEKRRHSSSHRHRTSKYHRSHHRHESPEKEDHDRRGSRSKHLNTSSKDDYRSSSHKHKKRHISYHQSRHSRTKDSESRPLYSIPRYKSKHDD